MIKLFIGNKAYSSWSMRGWLAVRRSGLAFEESVIPMFGDEWEAACRQPAFAASAGKVPVLSDGNTFVWDSLSIVEYCAEKAGRSLFWPEDAGARAFARSMAAEMHSGYQALRNDHSMNVRKRYAAGQLTEGTAKDVARIADLWGEARATFGEGGDYLFGEWGAADIMFAPVATRFLTYAIPLPPAAADYMEAALAHPHVREWMEDAAREQWVIEKYERPDQ